MSRNNPILIQMLIALFLGMVLLAFIGCKSVTPTLPTNTHSHDRDSVRTEYVHDSVYIDRWHTQYMKGDTCYIHDSIDRWRNKYVYIHDSIDNSRTDTIYETVQVEKPYKQFLVNSGIALWVLIVLFVIAVIIGIVIKFAK